MDIVNHDDSRCRDAHRAQLLAPDNALMCAKGASASLTLHTLSQQEMQARTIKRHLLQLQELLCKNISGSTSFALTRHTGSAHVHAEPQRVFTRRTQRLAGWRRASFASCATPLATNGANNLSTSSPQTVTWQRLRECPAPTVLKRLGRRMGRQDKRRPEQA